MTATLVAFATTGNPSTRDVEWPAWSAQNERFVSFGDRITLETVNRTRMEFMAKHRPAPGPPGGPRRFPRD
jgi:carboxylesterase type B